jgi:hypothetical protein
MGSGSYNPQGMPEGDQTERFDSTTAPAPKPRKIKGTIRGGMGAGRGDNANSQGY